jgi:hypothetical protein
MMTRTNNTAIVAHGALRDKGRTSRGETFIPVIHPVCAQVISPSVPISFFGAHSVCQSAPEYHANDCPQAATEVRADTTIKTSAELRREFWMQFAGALLQGTHPSRTIWKCHTPGCRFSLIQRHSR